MQIVGINPAAVRVLGVPAQEACQSSLFQWLVLPQAEAAPHQAPGFAWFDSLCHDRIQTIRRKDGSQAKVEVAGSAVDFAGDNAFQFCVREVTDRSRFEQQLRQAEKLSGLGQMMSGLVHELNTPLAANCGFVELSLLDAELAEQTRGYLTLALNESRRAAQLLQNVLNLARAGSAEKEYADLNGILRALIELRASDFRKFRVEVLQELAPQLPSVLVSRDQIQQVVIILLNNALQAMETVTNPKKLRLSTWQESNRAFVRVEDSGPGVPADLRAKIFEPFFTTKPIGVGTGLGLSLAHTFAMEHRGRICCDDSPLGGARFTVELPLPASAPCAQAPAVVDRQPASNLSQPTVRPAPEPVLAQARS